MPVADDTLDKILVACSSAATSLHDRWEKEHPLEIVWDEGLVLVPLLASVGARYQNISPKPFAVHFSIEDEHFVLRVTRKKVFIAELKASPTI